MKPGLDRERLWTAYIDGQLSASEAVAFEATLSPEERAFCAREIQFEKAIGDCLAEPVACPDAVWQQAVLQLSASAKAKPFLARPWVAWSAFAGLAAAVAFTLYDFPVTRTSPQFEMVLSLPRNSEELASESSTPADHDAVQQFMQQRDVPLLFADFSTLTNQGRHDVILLGARESGCHGRSVMEILFECCGEPAKVVLALQDTAAAEILQQGHDQRRVRYLATAGPYVMGVVTSHAAPDFTRLFKEPDTHLASGI